jgi:hypothetical protein
MENNELKERNIVSYGTGLKHGLRDKENDRPVIEGLREYGFGSLIPSRNNTTMNLPIVATFNRTDSNGHFIRGVVEIKGYNTNPNAYIIYEGYEYDFIDGFDGGLARVYKIIDGKKRWGIIGLLKTDEKIEVVQCQDTFDKNGNPKYDDIWNFYDKARKSTPAFIGGLAEPIHLEELRKELLVNDKFSVTKDEQVLIKNIEVTNFKRYSERTSIDLSSRITFFVGKNNAGKSTFLDAIEMCTRNMTRHLLYAEDGIPYFQFENNSSIEKQDDAFLRLLNSFVDSSCISFVLTSGEWKFEFMIDGGASIDSIIIKSTTSDAIIEFTKGHVELNHRPIDFNSYGGKWISYIPPKSKPKRDEDEERYKGIERLLAPLWEIMGQNKLISEAMRDEMMNSIDSAITTALGVKRLSVFASIGTKKYKRSQVLFEDEEYNRSANFVNDAIIDFYKIEDKYHQFVCKWLGYMDMGLDFAIDKDDNEDIYTMTIEQANGNVSDLCDMGSGTIHFVALCFKLLKIVDDNINNPYAPTVLIEEPEQNLHPMLQSHMANFLLDISNLYTEVSNGKELKMVVETHSEYLIRRSQVITKELYDERQRTPYRVYYFPQDAQPYDMIYKANGRFENEFGEGFTDESTLLSYQLL